MNLLLLLSLTAVFLQHVTADSVISSQEEAARRLLTKEAQKRAKFDIGQVITAIDNLHFEQQHVDLCGSIFCISANLTDGTVYGLGGFEALKSDFVTEGQEVIIDIDVNFPSLVLKSEYYEMEGNILGALPLAGRGKLHMETKNLQLWTKITLKIADDGISIEEFENPGLSIQNFYSRTEVDGNIDGIFNAMMEALLPLYLNRFNKAIATYSCQVIKELLNPIL